MIPINMGAHRPINRPCIWSPDINIYSAITMIITHRISIKKYPRPIFLMKFMTILELDYGL